MTEAGYIPRTFYVPATELNRLLGKGANLEKTPNTSSDVEEEDVDDGFDDESEP